MPPAHRLGTGAVATELQLVDGGDIFALCSEFDASYDSLSARSHLNRPMLEQLSVAVFVAT
jgi:hypothetical protein